MKVFSPIVQISVQGEPLDEEKLYRVTTSSAFVEGIQFFNSSFKHFISLKELFDTQEENWRVLRDHARALSPLNFNKLSKGKRLQTLQPDLGIFDHDIYWKPISKTPQGVEGIIQVQVKNYGCLPSPSGSFGAGPMIRLLHNKNGIQTSKDPIYEDIGNVQWVNQLNAGESQLFTWKTVLKPDSDLYSFTVKIEGNGPEANHQNDEITKWLSEEEVWPTEQLHLH